MKNSPAGKKKICFRLFALLLIHLPLLTLGGCKAPSPSIPEHLGRALTFWRSAFTPQTIQGDLDGHWEAVAATDEGAETLFRVPLFGCVEASDEIPAATLTLAGEPMPLQPLTDISSLREGEVYLDCGREIFGGIRAAFVRNDSATRVVDLRRGPVTVAVLAKGDPALGVAPKMIVGLNGKVIGELDVSSREDYVPYLAKGVAEEGKNLLEVSFVNDAFRPPEDRNLYVKDTVIIQPAVLFTRRQPGEGPPAGLHIEYLPTPPSAGWYRDLEPTPGLADLAGPWRYYEIGRETVPGVPLPPPGEVRFRLRPGQQGSVSFSYAVISSPPSSAQLPIVFKTALRSEAGSRTIDEFTVVGEKDRDTGRWVNRTCKLEIPGDGEAELVLTSRFQNFSGSETSGQNGNVRVLISEPILLSPASAAETIRNVVLVSLDTLRADHLGCYGYPVNTSPVLDRFARENVFFETAISESSWTLPSHVTMLSSLYVSAHGVSTMSRSLRNLDMIASILKKEGFHTKAITDGGLVAPAFGLCLGFDSYEDHDSRGFETVLPTAEDWLRRHSRRPFFLFLHTYDIHAPYHPPKRYRDRFPPPRYASPELVNGEAGSFLPRSFTPREQAANLQHVINMYDASIMYADDQMGRLFGLLRELDLWDNTMVIVTSDHGEEFLEHGGMGHGRALFEESIRIPLLVHVPGYEKGIKSTRIAQLVDVPPTILDYLEIESEAVFQGESLLQRIDNADSEPRVAYAEHEGQIAHRTLEEKFIHDFDGGKSLLFNLESDPKETKDLSRVETERCETLKENVREFRERNATMFAGKTSESFQLSGELREQLERLGYIGN